ncbi:MAG: hypothetical protein JWM93_2884 [Frankiales bacterium]|nr:hypothetical protein [Frankiales bacterium]
MSAWGAAAVGVLVGLVVAAVVGRSLARGSQGAVAPTVLLQLICLGEAFNMAQESQWEYAVPVALIAAGALAATFVGVRKQTHRA